MHSALTFLKPSIEKVPYVEPKTHIPLRYGTPTSALNFEVKAGKNTKDFDLTK